MLDLNPSPDVHPPPAATAIAAWHATAAAVRFLAELSGAVAGVAALLKLLL